MSETTLRPLVERLDSFHEDFDAQYGEAVPLLAAVLCAEASDEITKLKSELEEARAALRKVVAAKMPGEARSIARSVLEASHKGGE